MKINNFNHDKIEYKGNKMDEKLSFKDIVAQFYAQVRQQMPQEGSFDDIEMQCAEDDGGKYYLTLHTFFNNRTNSNVNNLNVCYIPDDKDFKMTMNLTDGSKMEILDFLGNENNLNKIKSYMSNLKRKTDLK